MSESFYVRGPGAVVGTNLYLCPAAFVNDDGQPACGGCPTGIVVQVAPDGSSIGIVGEDEPDRAPTEFVWNADRSEFTNEPGTWVAFRIASTVPA